MRDAGHDESDELLKKMQAEVEDVYRTAQKDLQKKIDDYVGKFAKDDAKKQKLVANGKMSQEDYEAWKQKTMLTGKQYRQMLNTVSTDLTNADKIARSIINGYTPEAYAVGMNYGTYQIESGTTFNTNFTLYNRETVERLLRDDPQLLPMPKVNIPKDKAWNYKHIKSAVTQGIIQGESMPKIAKRLENVVGMDKRAAIRNARTAVNGAENAGRMDSFYRAKEMGIGVKKQWLATPDGRTRDSHVEIDLEVVELEENFSNGCEYPGDPGGDPAEVYGCRCAMIPWLDRFGDKFDGERMMNLHGMTYDEWKNSRSKPAEKQIESQIEQESKPVHFESTKMRDAMARDDYEKFEALVNNSEAANAFAEYADECSGYRRDRNGGYYMPLNDSVTFSYEDHEGMSRYSTVAHETNHMIDRHAADKHQGRIEGLHFDEADAVRELMGVANFPHKISCCDEFLGALRSDMARLRESPDHDLMIMFRFRGTAFKNASSGVQDAFDGFFGGCKSGVCAWGHGEKYYNRFYQGRVMASSKQKELQQIYRERGLAKTLTETKAVARQYEAASEAWANVGSAIVCGGEELSAFEELMPNTVAAYREIIGMV